VPTLQHDAAELSPLELGAWRGLLRAHAALTAQLDAELEAAHGLPLTSYEVLINLAAAPERRLRMSVLAERVLLSRSGLSRMVDRLARAGLLERASCPSDARGAFAVLTGRGERLLAQARPTHLAGVRRCFLGLFSEPELLTLAEAWDRVSPGASGAGPAMDADPPC